MKRVCVNLLLWSASYGMFIRVTEGTGDNLDKEDFEAGYVDYINIDTYEYDGDEFSEVDGGIYMIKNYFSDIFSSDEKEKSEEKIIKYLIVNGIIPEPGEKDAYTYTILHKEYNF